MKKKFIRLDDFVLRKYNIPYKASTLRWWRATGKHKELFKKFGFRVYLDVEEFKRKIKMNAQ